MEIDCQKISWCSHVFSLRKIHKYLLRLSSKSRACPLYKKSNY